VKPFAVIYDIYLVIKSVTSGVSRAYFFLWVCCYVSWGGSNYISFLLSFLPYF